MLNLENIYGPRMKKRVHTTPLKRIYAYGSFKNVVMKYKVPALQY